MKKFANILLALVAIAAFAWCIKADGLQWFIGFMVLVVAVIELLRRNTNFIKEY
jgi:hypothetical protein